MRRLIAALVGVLILLPLPAFAHPHIFIDAKAAVSFNDAGQVVSIHNTWTFDEAYSAWSIQGLDTNHDGTVTRAELQPLANDNMDGLSEYEYYTFAGEGKDPNLKFGHGSNATIDFANGKTTLNFDVSLAQPYAIRKSLELSIDDPEYYVAITFTNASAIKLINAPKNCAVAMEDPKQMPDELADALYAIPPDVTKLPPELEQALRGMQGAILVNCPGGSLTGKGTPVAAAAPAGAQQAAVPAAATALDAATDMAMATPDDGSGAASGSPVDSFAAAAQASQDQRASQDRPTQPAPPVGFMTGNIPFGSAPNEPGFNLPRTGFLGWVAEEQKEFYLALTMSLAKLKTDWTGFWLLGTLSFLYGIFHAAGPGHGKVVISSYVLANEAQARRGILLSFIAAMLQSLVAIGFVLIAASVLGMTAMAMSDAANWIGVLSYGMVALLGLWLILRKIFGWGHKHSHNHSHSHDEEPTPDENRQIRAIMAQSRAHALLRPDPGHVAFALTGGDAYGRLPSDPHYGHSHAPPPPGRSPLEADDHDHGHAHVVTPGQLRGGWREQLGVVLAVGVRPCSGALIVLAFALSQGLLFAGIAAVLLMGLGTSITTGALATIAVGFKGLARGLAGADNKVTGALVWWAELLAAVGVFAFGTILLLANI